MVISLYKNKSQSNALFYKGSSLKAWSTACDTHLGSIKSSTVACGNTTSKKAHFIQWSFLVHLGQRDVGYHSVLREGAGPHKVKDLLSLASEAWGLVREQALALGYSAGWKHRERGFLFMCVWWNSIAVNFNAGQGEAQIELWFSCSGVDHLRLWVQLFFHKDIHLKNLVLWITGSLQHYLIFWQRLVLGFLQNLHSPHCGTYNGTTVSPGWKRIENN